MPKEIILTEKKKVAELFKAALEPEASLVENHYEGARYVIVWGQGHLFQLARPEQYDPALKRFSLATLPIEPQHYKFEPLPSALPLIKSLKAVFARDDIEALTIATDCGREGELIARVILEQCGWEVRRRQTYRFWTSGNLKQPEVIHQGLTNRQDYYVKDALYEAGLARMIGDWQVGINGSRALACRLRVGNEVGKISTGRVQGPVLRLIMTRQLERENFVAEEFWTLRGVFSTEFHQEVHTSWVASVDKDSAANFLPEAPYDDDQEGLEEETQGRRFSDVYELNKRINAACPHGMTTKALAEKLRITPTPGPDGALVAAIDDIITEDDTDSGGKVLPPQLHNLTTLQQEANRVHGMPMNRTSEVAQELYLDLGLISYPRTESKVLNTNMVDQVKVLMRILAEDKLIEFDPARLCLDGGTRNFDDNKIVEDHHAIIPSGIKPDVERMTTDQKKLYILIVKRFIAAFYPPYSYQTLRLTLRVGTELFEARKTVVIDGGWKEFLKGPIKAAGSKAPLEKITKDTRIWLKYLLRQHGKTTPPPPYNDASLLQAMTTIHNHIPTPDDPNEAKAVESLKRVLRQTSGLGTPATRGEIVAGMVEARILSRLGKGKGIEPTAKGRLIYDAIKDDSITDYETSAIWELELDKISQRNGTSLPVFLDQVRNGVRGFVDHVRNLPDNLVQLVDKIGPCPVCERDVINRAKSYSCEAYPDCSFVLWKNRLERFGKAEITRDEMYRLLRDQSIPLENLRGKNNSTFSVKGYLDHSEEYGWGISFREVDRASLPKKKLTPTASPSEPAVSTPPSPAGGSPPSPGNAFSKSHSASRSVPVPKPAEEPVPESAMSCCKKLGRLPADLPSRPGLFSPESRAKAAALWIELCPGIQQGVAEEILGAAVIPGTDPNAIFAKLQCEVHPLPRGIKGHLQMLKHGVDAAVGDWVRQTRLAPAFSIYQRVGFRQDGFAAEGSIQSIQDNRGSYLITVADEENDTIEIPWERTYCFKCRTPGAFLRKG